MDLRHWTCWAYAALPKKATGNAGQIIHKSLLEVMGLAASPSTGRRYGLVRACRALEIPRSTAYAARTRRLAPAPPRKRGLKTAFTDAELTDRIRGVLAASPFVDEGHRKAWARLQLAGARAGKPHVLRPMREANLLAPTRTGLALRHDHDSQFMSEHFQTGLRFLGIKSGPAFVREPEGNE